MSNLIKQDRKGITLRKNNKNSKKSKTLDATESLSIDTPVLGFKNRLKPRTDNQKEYIRTVAENTITFCQGLAGSGKTHIAIGMALEYLLDNKVKNIQYSDGLFTSNLLLYKIKNNEL